MSESDPSSEEMFESAEPEAAPVFELDELDDQLAQAAFDYEDHFGVAPYEPEGGFDRSTRAKHLAILQMSISDNVPQTEESLSRSLGYTAPEPAPVSDPS